MKIKLMATIALAAAALTACNSTVAPETESLYLIIGSYSSAADEGVRVYTFDEASGEAAFVSGLKGIDNPSFVYPAADGTRVYAVGENDAPAEATAHALAFDATKGQLSLLNTQPTHGDAPCNIIVSPDGKWVYTSNYNGGSITEFPLDADGKLGEGRVIAFSGSSVDSVRQAQPHLHAVNFTPDGHFLLANDLGTDSIHMFRAAGPIAGLDYGFPMPPGMGPRHLCFHPNGSVMYVLGELNGEVAAFHYLSKTEAISAGSRTLADSLHAEGSADIHISPDGEFLYTSHRLKGDGISIFRVPRRDTDNLEKIGYQPTGLHPRNFTISPDGEWLLVACRDDNMVQIFSRDAETGLLTDTGRKIEMPKPVCLQWIVR